MKIKIIIDMLLNVGDFTIAEFFNYIFVENPSLGIAAVVSVSLTILGLIYILRDDK